MTKFC